MEAGRPPIGPTIDLEARRDGVWVPREIVRKAPPRRRSWRWLRWLLWTLPAVSAGLVIGAVGLGLPQQSQAQTPSWRAAAKGDPAKLADAVVVGSESGLALYACRGPYRGGIEVGRYREDFSACHVGKAGHEIEVAPFEILSADWEMSSGVPAASLVGGELVGAHGSAVANVPLYPCRAVYRDGLHPGEIAAGSRGCSFGFGGRMLTVDTYSVLQAVSWMTWVPAVSHALPPTAVVGGQEGGEAFFVCRAHDATGLHPGKVKQTQLGCSIVSDGQEVVEKRFEVLVSRWVVSSGGAVPVAAVAAGLDSTGIQYLCRGQSKDMLQVGMVNAAAGGCQVGMQGGDIGLEDYEVLSQ